MTPFKRAAALFAGLSSALALGLVVPVAAQEPIAVAPTETASETVTIPFDPPIGTPLTYGLRFERKRHGGDSVFDYEQRLTFERIAEGFLLRLETLAFTVGGQRLDLADSRVMGAIPAALQPYFLPMTVELDAAGEMVRMRDWEAMRGSLRGLREAAAEMSGVQLNAAGRAAIAQFIFPILNASAEDAPALMIRGWPSVLGYGGVELDLGETYEAEDGIDSGLLPASIPAVAQFTLTRTPEGNLRLFQSTIYDPEAIRGATNAVIDAARAQVGGAGKSPAGETLDGMQLTDNADIVFDPTTGMPITAEVLRIVSVDTNKESGAGGEVMTIRRIAP
ncbi:MAG: hypothetical protein NBV68_10255 [Erythrobacter sp.]|uniref:hypothetical protein n=1 Tax=Erythrobacter sp. TaxID=1042 RepID=UPI0025E9F132|nr:hypothetical protein [Erythrobacter sp.]MCL9999755.1 hypothetical protein [Erythrobacter sp.]